MANGASRESKLTFTPPFGRDNVRRPKTAYACVFCRRSHMTCDDGRPCQRCIKRRIGHLCHDTHGLQLDGAPVPHSPVSDGVERDLKIGQEGSTPEGASVEMYEGFYLPANSPHPAQMTFPDCNDLCSRFARVCEELYLELSSSPRADGLVAIFAWKLEIVWPPFRRPSDKCPPLSRSTWTKRISSKAAGTPCAASWYRRLCLALFELNLVGV